MREGAHFPYCSTPFRTVDAGGIFVNLQMGGDFFFSILSSRWTADDHLKEVSQQSRIFLGTRYVKPLQDLFTLGIKK